MTRFPAHIIVAVVLVLQFAAGTASAGHGLMNAFSDPPPLPEAGVTPAQMSYFLDEWHESIAIATTSSGFGKLHTLLEIADEKLAESLLLVSQHDQSNASVAVSNYASVIAELIDEIETIAHTLEPEQIASVMQRLLEQQYFAAFDYLEYPRERRTPLLEIQKPAGTAYELLKDRLSRREAEAFFFKEEEIRWQWEMAIQGDHQGL